ncbi:MAG: leucyl aminopeptidase [Bryobacteraceae bacterium]
MKITLERNPVEHVAAAALIVPVFEREKESRFGAAPFVESGEVAGKADEFTLLHNPTGAAAARVLLAGGGKAGRFDAAGLRKLVAASVRFLKEKNVQSAAVLLEGNRTGAEYASAAVEGAILGDFEPNRHKTGSDKKTLESFAVVCPGGAAGLDAAVARGQVLAESQNFTRALANEPANLLTPLKMAAAARQMSQEQGLECEVLERGDLERLGMGALLGVAQGSAEPPVLIVIRYRPQEAASAAHLGLIGKGVTFDTGGISIKPSEGMEKMKYDMSGGAAMLGAIRAIAQLKPPLAVTAFIPCVENMPGSRAQRPGDIVTSMSGKTVEVLNTDAEGRLILADALAYARRQGCTHLVDAATLTGAIVVALGHIHAGLFSSDDALRDRVLRAARAEGERMWPMPLDEDYKEGLKSAFADIANIGPRWGGAITAAIFLKEFAAETPWVHLDIAGTAWLDEAQPHMPKGPTGLPVRTLVRLATDWTD